MFPYSTRRPGWRMFLCVWMLAGGLLPAAITAAQEPFQWTLVEALKEAFANSPALRAQEAELEEVASRLVGAKIYPHNPEVSLEMARRSGPGSSTTDRGLSLVQEIEVAGQRAKRIAVAKDELGAADAHLLRAKRLLVFRVEMAFVAALRGRDLLAVARTDVALAREVLEFSQRRLDRGAATQIEVNLARASAGRAERSVQQAQASSSSARSRLAELAGTNPREAPEPVGDLTLPEGDLPELADLLRQAFENRGDLLAAERLELAAEAAIRLAKAESRPKLMLGGFYQREEATDDIFGATVGVSLPLFNRNQGRIAGSRATRERLRHEAKALGLTVEQEVVVALNDLRAARRAAEYLRDQVLGTLEENIDLLQRSFAAGRIGATEVVILRREFVASRREYVEALADVWQARTALNLAIGHFTLPETAAVKELP